MLYHLGVAVVLDSDEVHIQSFFYLEGVKR